MGITNFRGRYRFLSNFYPSPSCNGDFDFPTVEHAFQAAKTDDADWHHKIRTAPTPASAKIRGRQAPMVDDWEETRLDVMKRILQQKFAPGSRLAGLLLATGDAELVEGNYWNDRFWGVCGGTGENHLGRLLMEVREELRG